MGPGHRPKPGGIMGRILARPASRTNKMSLKRFAVGWLAACLSFMACGPAAARRLSE